MYHHQKFIRSCLCLERISYNQKWRSNALLCLSSTNQQLREYSNPAKRPSMWSQFVENMKQEYSKNKEMKESLQKFREEREKLEQSDALKKARTKFQAVESEASKSSELLKEKLGTIKEKVQEAMDEVGKSDIAKKAGHFTEEIGKSAKEKLSKTSQGLGESETFKTVSGAAEVVREELQTGDARMYQAPVVLRKRKETISDDADEKPIEPNQEATGMELHKDSRFYESWQKFKENNPYVNKVVGWKMKFDESDNILLRATRIVTDKVGDLVSSLFQKNQMSETLTEICKLDPSFEPTKFIRMCETDIIPNILEAMIRGDLEILRDWCHEGPYNILSTPIKQAQKMGAYFDSKVLDIGEVNLQMGLIVDQGPVLVIHFVSQQIMCLRDSKGTVIEGDPETVHRVNYVWVLCRDPSELNPRAAWRLLELAASSQSQNF